MPTTAIVIGVLHILIGVIGYVIGMSGGGGSLTALIPAVFGLIIAAAGFISRANDGMRKTMMHIAGISRREIPKTASRLRSRCRAN